MGKGRFSSCCRKPKVDAETETQPEPALEPEPVPEPEPEPSTSEKIPTREPSLRESKPPGQYTELSILCMKTRSSDPSGEEEPRVQ